MKLKNFYIFCLACITCIAWIMINRKLQVLNDLLNPCIYSQVKTNQIGIAGWLAKKEKFDGKFKYILLWPSNKFSPFDTLAAGQDKFIRLGCPVTNCFGTANKTFFKDIRSFEFIAFMGRVVYAGNLPKKRAMHQKYIYFNMESSPNYPVEDKYFDGFFNWTATYRLDSDIPVPYIQIRDKEDNIVGPKINMEWVREVRVDEKVLPSGLMNQKTQAAAIFSSNCRTLSVREELVTEIQNALNKFSLNVDVFGACGPYKCPRRDTEYCNDMLTKKYFFYFSFENSFDIDYVTEKLLTAVQNYVVPVVYGGANYSRFLPPGSYLDATNMTATKLADTIVHLMGSHERYLQYFWWTKYYTYHNPILDVNICNVCAAMNNKEMLKKQNVYKKFRRWWNNNDN